MALLVLQVPVRTEERIGRFYGARAVRRSGTALSAAPPGCAEPKAPKGFRPRRDLVDSPRSGCYRPALAGRTIVKGARNGMSTLGMKHECFSCGSRFYDLGKPEAICPKCGANQKDAKRAETPSESAAKRKRREEVARPVEHPEEEITPQGGDDEFPDDEIEAPEGVEEEEAEEPEDDEE
jgi:hypothetical protein